MSARSPEKFRASPASHRQSLIYHPTTETHSDGLCRLALYITSYVALGGVGCLPDAHKVPHVSYLSTQAKTFQWSHKAIQFQIDMIGLTINTERPGASPTVEASAHSTRSGRAREDRDKVKDVSRTEVQHKGYRVINGR